MANVGFEVLHCKEMNAFDSHHLAFVDVVDGWAVLLAEACHTHRRHTCQACFLLDSNMDLSMTRAEPCAFISLRLIRCCLDE